MPLDGRAQVAGAARASGADGREEPAARRVQLLVARTAPPRRDLPDPVAEEARVGVAVDEPRDRAETAAVELLHLAELEARELPHRSDRRDLALFAEDEGVLDHVHVPQRTAADRS